MRIAVVCRSDSTGGAAIVSRRLTEALRHQGEDARMLVLEKKTNLPFIEKANFPILRPLAFLAERLQIFLRTGFSRKNLWKIDTGRFGLPIWRHPVIREADLVILNWVNQGMLSLNGIRKICRSGKKVVWTMHDMWNMTGVCHHAMGCRHFERSCQNCPLGYPAHKVWKRKKELYGESSISFVAVSSWLASEARRSSLLRSQSLALIPNPFEINNISRNNPNKVTTILFSAATLDNWIKGLDTFKAAVNLLAGTHTFRVLLMGNLKNPAAIEGFDVPIEYLGAVGGEDALAEVYSQADVVVNASAFENLPGTLVEAQAYGAVPVAFDRGGQSDIIEHLHTGYLASWSDDPSLRARNLAEGIAWALDLKPSVKKEMTEAMKKSVEEKFSYTSVVSRYLSLMY